ncbi:hypothetical protein [Bacteroides uniformis]|uniref:hypothetical protein n=1 Tax=Bacteroides uniformis TaxID=820 RepID=UPI00232B06E5|nr:hypothetical protein [Bacteroides uniformis]MDC1819705.1 hypothetical protein [Bacteroides uniformis]
MNYHPEKTLMGCLATFLFLIALMGAYLKYAEAVEAGTEGAPALLYMLVMFFVIFIVAGSVTALLVGILTPMATQGVMRLLSVHHRTSLPEGEEVASVKASLHQAQADERRMAHQQALKDRNAQSLQQQTEEILRKEKQVLEEIFAYTRGTFQKVFTPTQIDTLIQNIQELYRVNKAPAGEARIYNFKEVETENASLYYNYDLEHYGWNVSTRIRMLCKKMNQGETIPHFLKVSFPYAFAGKEETSIKTKLTNETSRLPLIKEKEEMVPYVFPGTEQLPDKTD